MLLFMCLLVNFCARGYDLKIFSSILAFFMGVNVCMVVYETLESIKPVKISIALLAIAGFVHSLTQTGLEPGGFMLTAPRLGMLISLALILNWNVSKKLSLALVIMAVAIKEVASVAILAILINNVWVYLAMLCFCGALHKQVWRSIELRLETWTNCLPIAKSVHGVGFGVFPFKGVSVSGYDQQIYSTFLKTFFGIGYSFVGWLVFVIKKIRFNKQLIALGALCCIEYPLEVTRLWFVFAVTLAIILIEKGEHSVKDSKN